jgi:lysyl-tRNA synthetase class 2
MSFQPTASLELLRLRAVVLEQVRTFFKSRQVLEVDTPILGLAPVTDPVIQALQTQISVFGSQRFYLQTSPEYYLKRLIACYPVSVYQLGKVFRDDEYGRYHSPEFTMLEWYRIGFNDAQLIAEMKDLLTILWAQFYPTSLQIETLSYKEVFQRHLNIDPHRITLESLQALVTEKLGSIQGLPYPTREVCLQLLMSAVIEPALVSYPGPVFIIDYPAAQAALARLREDEEGNAVSGRFEVYWQGIELANGYDELTDAAKQQERFARDCTDRSTEGLPEVPVDHHLLQALESGLSPCAGVALGFDRLLMVLAGVKHIESVLTFYRY